MTMPRRSSITRRTLVVVLTVLIGGAIAGVAVGRAGGTGASASADLGAPEASTVPVSGATADEAAVINEVLEGAEATQLSAVSLGVAPGSMLSTDVGEPVTAGRGAHWLTVAVRQGPRDLITEGDWQAQVVAGAIQARFDQAGLEPIDGVTVSRPDHPYSFAVAGASDEWTEFTSSDDAAAAAVRTFVERAGGTVQREAIAHPLGPVVIADVVQPKNGLDISTAAYGGLEGFFLRVHDDAGQLVALYGYSGRTRTGVVWTGQNAAGGAGVASGGGGASRNVHRLHATCHHRGARGWDRRGRALICGHMSGRRGLHWRLARRRPIP